MDRKRVLTNGGPLLEQFARLATNVAGSSAAVVGVLGQRKGLAPRRAAYGLSREQVLTFREIEAILDDDDATMTVPDMTADERFEGVAFHQPRFRFLTYMK